MSDSIWYWFWIFKDMYVRNVIKKWKKKVMFFSLTKNILAPTTTPHLLLPPSIFSGLAKRHRRQCGFRLLNAFPMTIWPQHVRNNWEKCTAKKPQKYSGGRRTTLPLDSLTDRRIDIAWFEKKIMLLYVYSTYTTPTTI